MNGTMEESNDADGGSPCPPEAGDRDSSKMDVDEPEPEAKKGKSESEHGESERGEESERPDDDESRKDGDPEASDASDAAPDAVHSTTGSCSNDANSDSNAKPARDEGNDDSVDSESTDAKPKSQDGEIHEIGSDSDNDRSKPATIDDDDSEDDELDSEEDSERSEEDSDGGPPEDVSDDGPVSIGSDSEPDERRDDKSGEVLLIDDDQEGKTSPTVHEIASDNDDCVVTGEKDADGLNKSADSIRRSSRIMDKKTTHKRYGYDRDEDGSDVEEVIADAKNATIVINSTKKLADLATIKQNGKANSASGGQKKEPTVVIIDTNSIGSGKAQAVPVPTKVPFSNMPAQALYESMAARGTTVTPLSAKPTPAPPPIVVAPAAPIILPSLTDDMFVVEAPSFIVPYVYEKPSLKPFREFVDILGKELDEQIKKEEQERAEKEKEMRERFPSSKKEESSAKSKDKEEPAVESKKSSRKANRRRMNDDDDASWDGESTSDSDMSDDERPKTIIIKEKDDDSLDAIKDPMVTDLTSTSSKDATKTNTYFDNSLGKFFINIGMNLVQEYVQSDLLKQQKRKLQRESRAGSGNTKATESAINSLTKNLEFSKENNAPYKFEMKKCEFCSFKTESALSLAHHMETPHMKNGIYKCNFCNYEVRSPHDILFHMEAEHNTRGRLERAPSYHQCPNCPFEDNGKGKLGRHQIACAKKFRPDYNLMPPVDWEPPAKIPKATHVRQNVMSSYQSVFAKMQPATIAPPMMTHMNRGRGRPQMIPSLKPVQGAPIMRGGVMLRQPAPNQSGLSSFQTGQVSNHIPKALQHQPSISITPLPRTAAGAAASISSLPSALNNAAGSNKSAFVICEICDGYIKDLEQLRNHMQWIHKVKIHPKMIYNRPPLNCQKCQFRFFTDQGLERHLLGSHGLVTSSMQEAANKSNDSGRCPICGRVYQWKLLNHVSRDHNLQLKPAHLSYKCTVCTATFGMYRQFENHVYSAHSVVAKRAADKSKGGPAPAAASSSKASVTPGGSLLKPVT